MKHIKFLLFLTILFVLVACAPSKTSIPEATLTPQATSVPIPSPTEKPILPTATLEPSPTPAPLLFRDDFEGSLEEGWNWTRENQKTWSLTENLGWLEIVTGSGSIGSGNLDNVLLRQIPDGNFEIETKMDFDPIRDYQLAGLLIYESAANHIVFGRAFCDTPNSCVNDGFYMDLTYQSNFDTENFSVPAGDDKIAYLRLRREENRYTAYASHDGQEWQLIGEKTSEMKPMFIGLLAGQSMSMPQPAQFDYFVVNQLP
ncbi:MAG: DUF1349 domain-containing protein [Chloroflexi bacterium]|nr:DUF1349 domain-containing protein [Chloroflexota bacterium]